MTIENMGDEEFVARTLEAAVRLAYRVDLDDDEGAELVSDVLYGRAVNLPRAAVTVPPGTREPRRDDTLVLYSPAGSAAATIGMITPQGFFTNPAFRCHTVRVPFRYTVYRHPDDAGLYESYSPDCGRLGSGANAREAKEQLADRIVHAVRTHRLTAPDYVTFANAPDADRWMPTFVRESGTEEEAHVADRGVLYVSLPSAYWASLAITPKEATS